MTKAKQSDIDKAEKLFVNPTWRLNNLYYIVDKRGHKIKFTFNWAQKELYESLWYCNVILKARQLGISTFICLLFLDRCLFNPNMSAGIVAHTVEDAQALFRRVKIAYDSLPDEIKAIITAENDTANMLKFSNGSSIRIGTSLRSSTFQYLHVSEFGKICAKYPDKAQEIVTGSLNTVAAGQYVFIESTAEGRSGPFYEICQAAQKAKMLKRELSKLDFKFHFFPWWKEPEYRIGNTFPITGNMEKYFMHLANLGINIDEEQKAWYIARETTQQDDMRREYPSTPEESWEVAHEGLYYSRQMSQARAEKRVGFVPYDEDYPVHTAWDLGFNDNTCIWFFQIIGKEIRLIDYCEGGDSLQHWIGEVKKREYTYDKHIAPHDMIQTEYAAGITRQQSARKMGMNFQIAKRADVIVGIDAVRTMLARCWFDERKCEKGIKCLDNYKKDWDEKNGTWRSGPLHNWASHGCFTGDTLLLTRFGRLPIMLIEKDMEILTLKGWKKCNKAMVTKKNAQLVEVTFKDGMKVKCTPDHLFLTEKGWISAENLERNIEIRSSLIQSQHILEDLYIESGRKKDILKKVDHICIEMFGRMHLVKYLTDVIFTIKMKILKIIHCLTLNVYHQKFILDSSGQIQRVYLTKQEKKRANGINLKKEENGIEDKLFDAKVGQSGKEKKKDVLYATNYIKHLLGKTDMLKNIALQNVNHLRVLGVKRLNETADVYCISVPEVSHFSLANGAVVHNSDAMRTLATGLHFIVPTEGMNLNSQILQQKQYMQSRFDPCKRHGF